MTCSRQFGSDIQRREVSEVTAMDEPPIMGRRRHYAGAVRAEKTAHFSDAARGGTAQNRLGIVQDRCHDQGFVAVPTT